MKTTDTTLTPGWVLDIVRQVAPIGLDPCGAEHSLVSARREYRLDRGQNGLTRPWSVDETEQVFCNPPYSHGQIPRFVAMAIEEARRSLPSSGFYPSTSQLLLPADTSTEWFRIVLESASAWALPAKRIAFLRWSHDAGKLDVVRDAKGRPGSPKFGSLVALFCAPRDSGFVERFVDAWRPHGAVFVRHGQRLHAARALSLYL